MGERVVVGRATRVEPVEEPRDAPPRTAPLEYGRGDRAGDAWRWLRARGGAVLENAGHAVQRIVATLGGWRRVTFAFGLAILFGGLGDCLAGGGGGGAFWMFVGGILIGLTLRVPLQSR